jgi:hypothetical protein
MSTDAQIQEAVDKLNRLFHRHQRWMRDRDGSYSSFDPSTLTIYLKDTSGVAHLIHEYVHALEFERNGQTMVYREGGTHGPSFIKILEEVATAFYGSPADYPNWGDEYPHITGYAYAKGYVESPIPKSLRFSELS